MKVAHLILAHNKPKQLERLINSLTHPDAAVYIHLDKKTDIAPFVYLKDLKNVYFVQKRIKVYWGSFNIVKATLNGFHEIIASGNTYDYINLLSGHDYPLQSSAYIHDYLARNKGTIFMRYLLFDPDWNEALSRIREYHFNNLQIPGSYTFQKIITKLLPQRLLPNHLIPVGGSQWFTIPMECIAYIIKYWADNPKLQRFIKLTWAPDEFIFQTILYNSTYLVRMVNNDLRYIDWTGGGVSPKLLAIEDADKLVNSGKLYARKFDMEKDEAILDLIDLQHKKLQ